MTSFLRKFYTQFLWQKRIWKNYLISLRIEKVSFSIWEEQQVFLIIYLLIELTNVEFGPRVYLSKLTADIKATFSAIWSRFCWIWTCVSEQNSKHNQVMTFPRVITLPFPTSFLLADEAAREQRKARMRTTTNIQVIFLVYTRLYIPAHLPATSWWWVLFKKYYNNKKINMGAWGRYLLIN